MKREKQYKKKLTRDCTLILIIFFFWLFLIHNSDIYTFDLYKIKTLIIRRIFIFVHV